MATICQKCGATGYSELLNYCSSCQTSVEHWYCMDELPKDFNAQVHWVCEQCKQKVPTLASHDRPKFYRAPNTITCSLGFDYVEAPEQPPYIPARPIFNHIWSGSFDIHNVKYGPVTAYLSEKACEKVCNCAKMLPPVLFAEKISRLDTWPESFKTSPPTDDNIGIYFFPEDARAASVLDQLLEDVTNKDLVLKIKVDNAELLVFSSIILPAECHRFHGKYYLWGVFKGRQVAMPSGGDTRTTICPFPHVYVRRRHRTVHRGMTITAELGKLNN